jgi:hypothetical protein
MPLDRPIDPDKLPLIRDAAADVETISARWRAMRWTFFIGFVLILIGQLRVLGSLFFPAFTWIVTSIGVLLCLSAVAWVFQWRDTMLKSDEKKLAYIFGVVFVVVLLVIAVFIPSPSAFQYTVFRIVLALAAAGVAAMIPGFLQVQVSTWLRAGGALAIFVIVYFYAPAALEKLK